MQLAPCCVWRLLSLWCCRCACLTHSLKVHLQQSLLQPHPGTQTQQKRLSYQTMTMTTSSQAATRRLLPAQQVSRALKAAELLSPAVNW